MLLFLACHSPDPAPSHPDDDTAVSSAWGSTLADAGLCAPGAPGTPPEAGPYTGVATPSPFGTGSVSGVTLGALDDPSVLDPGPQPDTVDEGMDLDTETFDLYIPPDYDGTEPYGLVAFINAGDDGAVHGEWTEVLDEAHLIWVGGRGIGNPVDTSERMGLTVLGTWRALELFNIDRSRVYLTGTSGGARVAHVTSFYFPTLYPAAFPLCGAAWPREVTQAYETQEPDSHYEYWGDWYYPDVDGQDFLSWLQQTPPRYALMTSYDDFREGDIQNVYHYGAMEDGFAVRILERPGEHCATDPDRLRDALAWVESPDFTVIDDALGGTPNVGNGVVDAGSPDTTRVEVADGLTIHADPGAPGLVLARDRVAWADAAGGVFAVTWEPGDVGFAGAKATFGLWSWDATARVDALDTPAIVVSAEGEGPTVTVSVRTGGEWVEVFSGVPSDWEANDSLRVELQPWEGELQVRTDHHFGNGATVAEAAKLLDDTRIMRMRWEDAGFGPEEWSSEGAVVGLGVEATGDTPVAVKARDLLARDATGWGCE